MALEKACMALHIKAGTVGALTHGFGVFFFKTYDSHLKHLTPRCENLFCFSDSNFPEVELHFILYNS